MVSYGVLSTDDDVESGMTMSKDHFGRQSCSLGCDIWCKNGKIEGNCPLL